MNGLVVETWKFVRRLTRAGAGLDNGAGKVTGISPNGGLSPFVARSQGQLGHSDTALSHLSVTTLCLIFFSVAVTCM